MNNLETIAWVLAVFALLNSLSKFLTFISEKTESKTDDKIASYFSKGLTYLSKLIDLFTANTKQK